jgi:VanZ family protein
VEIGKRFATYQIPFFVWGFGIFVASSIPAEYFPNSPILSHDKLLHVIIFFGFALLLERALHHQDRLPMLARRSHLATLVITVLYGAFDEVHQAFIPGRFPDKYDLLADTVGAVAAITVVWLLARRRRQAATQ